MTALGVVDEVDRLDADAEMEADGATVEFVIEALTGFDVLDAEVEIESDVNAVLGMAEPAEPAKSDEVLQMKNPSK